MATPAQTPHTYQTLSAASGVPVGTLRAWRLRGKLPEPDGRVGASPTWSARRVSHWLREHGRQEANA